MSEELKPCPFCGSDAHIDGGEDYGFYATCGSADCFCCVGEAYDRDAMPEHMFPEPDAAIAAWNRRAPMTAPTPAGEEGERAINIARAFLEHPDDGNAADFVRMGDLRIVCRALLSSPRVEEVRREALEEAAKVADEMAVNRARVSGVAEHACKSIATRIRALATEGSKPPAHTQEKDA